MSQRAVFLGLLLAACGDGNYSPRLASTPFALDDTVSLPSLVRPAAASPAAPRALETAPWPRAPAGPVLERPEALRHFFARLRRLDERVGRERVRIVQFGDSHTAADVLTATVRRALQGRFGDGGRGFVALGKPWKQYVQDGVQTGMTKEWVAERGGLVGGHGRSDGCYGLGGVCLLASRRGGRAWVEVSAPATRLELSFLEQPRGGSFELFIDGARVARISTRRPRVASAFRTFSASDAPHTVEVRTRGDGEVRLFGLGLDRDRPGVTLDALGINGARAAVALQWSESHMTEQLRHRAPDLVVIAYGTNEAGDDTPTPVYERQLVDVLGRVARAVPSASCLLLGPPDRAIETEDGWMTSSRLLEVIAAQRRVADAAGCAYYNQFEAMGGPGSIAAWAEDPLPRAQRDRVHLTRDGYTRMGTGFAADLVRAYSDWRAETSRPAHVATGR